MKREFYPLLCHIQDYSQPVTFSDQFHHPHHISGLPRFNHTLLFSVYSGYQIAVELSILAFLRWYLRCCPIRGDKCSWKRMLAGGRLTESDDGGGQYHESLRLRLQIPQPSGVSPPSTGLLVGRDDTYRFQYITIAYIHERHTITHFYPTSFSPSDDKSQLFLSQ